MRCCASLLWLASQYVLLSLAIILLSPAFLLTSSQDAIQNAVANHNSIGRVEVHFEPRLSRLAESTFGTKTADKLIIEMTFVKALNDKNSKSRKKMLSLLEQLLCPEDHMTFRDYFEGNHIKTMYPSSVWIPDAGVFVLVTRVYIRNKWSKFYAQIFDIDYNEITNSSIKIGSISFPTFLSIIDPTANISPHNTLSIGPEDPRIFHDARQKRTFVNFNMRNEFSRRSMYIYTFETNHLLEILAPTTTSDMYHYEKNWTPIINSKLSSSHFYFIQNFEGPTVIQCNILSQEKSEQCSLVQGNLDNEIPIIKGSSPMLGVPGESGYYYGMIHGHHPGRIYRMSFAIYHQGFHPNGSFFANFVYIGKYFDIKPVLKSANLRTNTFIQMSTSYAISSRSDGHITRAPSGYLFLNLQDDDILLLKVENFEIYARSIAELHRLGKITPDFGNLNRNPNPVSSTDKILIAVESVQKYLNVFRYFPFYAMAVVAYIAQRLYNSYYYYRYVFRSKASDNK